MKPSELLHLLDEGNYILSPVAFDTETSGLYVDDGARVSTVSVAWRDLDDTWTALNAERNLGLNIGVEDLVPGIPDLTTTIVSTAWPFDQGVAGTGKPEDHGQTTLWSEADNLDYHEWNALCKFLQRVGSYTERNLVAHNAKFDALMMNAGVRRWPGAGVDLIDLIYWDTQNGQSLLYPLLQDPVTKKVTTSLKPSCSVLFKAEFADEKKKVDAYLKKARLPLGRWDLMPWDVIGPYADLDARMTSLLQARQSWEILHNKGGAWLGSVEDVYTALDRRLAVTRVLYAMEKRGLPYDEAASMEAALLCEERAQAIVTKLPFQPTLPAAKDFFFGSGETPQGVKRMDLVPYATTDTGGPQMTEEIVDRMVADGIPHAAEWAKYQKVQTATSMWYRGYAQAVGPDGRLRTAFRQNGTRSHRFSVERVNLQAIPQDFRLEGFDILEGIPTPRKLVAQAVQNGFPGWSLWELDLAQAELRVAAWFANCKRMLEMITRGEDLHTFTTQELFQVAADDTRFGKYRQVGKRANFSLIFGTGPETFRKMVSKETGIQLPDIEAANIVTRWNRLYPEYSVAIEEHMDRVAKRQMKYGKGWISLINNERRWFEKYEDAHKAFNQRVQPNLAQFGLSWMLLTEQIVNSYGIEQRFRQEYPGQGGAGLILTIHDSQVLMLPNDELGHKILSECTEAGRKLWHEMFDVPGAVDCKAWVKVSTPVGGK